MTKLQIKTLSQVLQTGLCIFLVTGLTGCTDKKCDDLQYAPQWRVDECKKEQINPTSGSSSVYTSSGFFLMPAYGSGGNYHSTNHSSCG